MEFAQCTNTITFSKTSTKDISKEPTLLPNIIQKHSQGPPESNKNTRALPGPPLPAPPQQGQPSYWDVALDWVFVFLPKGQAYHRFWCQGANNTSARSEQVWIQIPASVTQDKSDYNGYTACKFCYKEATTVQRRRRVMTGA